MNVTQAKLVIGWRLGKAMDDPNPAALRLFASLFDVIKPRYHASAGGIMLCCAFIFGSSSSNVLGWMKQAFSMQTGLASLAGFYLAGADFRRVLVTRGAYVAAALRLVAFPLAFVGALWLLKAWLDRTMCLALVVAASAPVAAMVTAVQSPEVPEITTSVPLS